MILPKRHQENRCRKHRFSTGVLRLIALPLFLLTASLMRAGDGPFLVELGLQGGLNYYIGDANNIPFARPREIYGAQFRYKFDRRWALQIKGQASRIAFLFPVDGAGFVPNLAHQQKMTNKFISLDACAEYNFFRFGNDWSTGKLKPYTPYVFLGLGLSLYDGKADYENMALYIPFGVGFKWKFAKHAGLCIAWQHNIYFVDNLENIEEYDNIERLNGSNFLNCDLTGNLTFGLVFDFIEAKKVCRTCDW